MLGGVALNVLVLFLVSLAAFSRVTDRLFTGFDGRGIQIFVRQLFEWSATSLSLPSNPFEGMGGLFFVNARLVPSLIALGAVPGTLGIALAYAITALELFLATYLLGRALGFPYRVCLVASWILPLIAVPFFEFALINPILGIAANFGDAIAAHTIVLALFAFALNGPLVQRTFASILLAALAVWSISSQPTSIVLILPSGLGLCAALIVQLPNWRQRMTRPLLPLLSLLVIVAAGGASYLYGLFADTASAFFKDELNQTIPRVSHLASIAFQWKVTDWSGLLLFAGALFGFLFSLLNPADRKRALVVAGAIVPQLIIVAAFFATSKGWVYPFPVYFEFALWSIYALYASQLVSPVLVSIGARVRRHKRASLIFAGIPVAAAILLHFQPTIPRNDIWGKVPVKDSITTAVAQDIALNGPGQFRGYAATFMGYGGVNGPPADWAVLLTHGLKLTGELGNPMRAIGLWQYDIPTLEEYQPITSPTLYLVLTRLLARKIDKQWRNVFVLTNPNLGLLQALGVRFVIADRELGAPATRRIEVKVKDVAEPIRLFELSDPNIGNYSPVEVIKLGDVGAALAVLGEPNFDFRRRVITFDEVAGALEPVASAAMTVERGPSYIVRAASPGRSLLLLPLQYSHCLQVQVESGTLPRLLRANITQAALLIEGDVTVRLTPRTGLFYDHTCRWHNAKEIRQLGLGAR